MENSITIKNKFININISEFIYIIIAVLPFFLLMNRYQYLSIISFLFLSILSIIYFLHGKPITQYHFRINILLLIICFYLLWSYFISGQLFSNLFEFGFLRYDGNFFFSYLPFFIFSISFINYRKALKVYFWFLFIGFVFFALIGFFEYINKINLLTVRIDDIYVGQMFIGLNNSHNATGSVLAVASIFALSFFLESK